MQRNLICYSSKWNYYALDETPVTSIMIILKKNFDILCMSCSRIPQDLRNQRKTLIIIAVKLYAYCIRNPKLCFFKSVLQLLQGTNVSLWPRQRPARCFYARIFGRKIYNFASCISIIIGLQFGARERELCEEEEGGTQRSVIT